MEARREMPLGGTQEPHAAPGVWATVQRWLRWAQEHWLLPILALAALVRFYDLTAAAIWGDEGSSLLLSQFSLSGIWLHAAHDVHPPLYFFLLHGWIGLFGDGIFSIRCLSAVPGIVTVWLGVWLMDLLATRRAALLAGFLLALLPTAVRYSQEVRMYSLLGLWLIGATIALVYWIRRPHRPRYLVAYALLMTAAFYTHYFTALCVLCHWLYLGLIRVQPGYRLRHIQRPGWWLANAAIVLLFLPWLPSLVDLLRHMDQLRANGDVGWELPVTLSSLPSMLWSFLIQDDGETLPALLFIALPLALLVIAGVALARDRSVFRGSALLVIYTALPLLLVFGVSFITPVFIERYLTAYALGLPMIVALAVDRLYSSARLVALAVLLLFIGVELVGLKNNATVDPQDQINVMVDYVNQHFVSGDRIVTSDMLWYLSYVYYNRTDTRPLLYTPPSASGASTRPNAYGFGTLVTEDTYVDSLDRLANNGRVWLIGAVDGPDEFAPLPAGWHRVSETRAGGAYARLIVRP
ncbi:glycosyltransferase family 39 protein [Pseudomonas sp. 14P_8.1_Bac3]|uniref:glycosyltransferase family 39 protein n=1 Tax=Pseudomonas sp. 14P_8.1_Bac3 TaxID=2971621 RepID=UPI0021C64CC1|nr:glycosyltransferase family 39 protein [Pseudomonas sp. 14P_8.1_Bac3]MCU1762032.1 glycosyltransferase family 39 protein [Pseudomonas sp. 14P_8.1_Bac3]